MRVGDEFCRGHGRSFGAGTRIGVDPQLRFEDGGDIRVALCLFDNGADVFREIFVDDTLDFDGAFKSHLCGLSVRQRSCERHLRGFNGDQVGAGQPKLCFAAEATVMKLASHCCNFRSLVGK